jgi:serine/threonine protein kinase
VLCELCVQTSHRISDATVTLSAGTRLGPYEILTLIGSGGMGDVYRARDTRLDRDVAMKVLPAQTTADPERLLRFDSVINSLGKLGKVRVVPRGVAFRARGRRPGFLC